MTIGVTKESVFRKHLLCNMYPWEVLMILVMKTSSGMFISDLRLQPTYLILPMGCELRLVVALNDDPNACLSWISAFAAWTVKLSLRPPQPVLPWPGVVSSPSVEFLDFFYDCMKFHFAAKFGWASRCLFKICSSCAQMHKSAMVVAHMDQGSNQAIQLAKLAFFGMQNQIKRTIFRQKLET